MIPSTLKIIRDEHAALAAMFASARMLIDIGPKKDPVNFFEVLRAMLFYIDEFPERLHHPKETELLFPRVEKAAPELASTLARLDHDHEYTEKAVRGLQNLLIAWEIMGESRREPFVHAFNRYMQLYLAHMKLEEDAILPAAKKHLTAADWEEIDAAFEQNRDPLTKQHEAEDEYEHLFTRILSKAPAPVGLG